jgi:hypothetical protein
MLTLVVGLGAGKLLLQVNSTRVLLGRSRAPGCVIMWNVTNLRGTKTLSQFPPVTVSPVTSTNAPAAVRNAVAETGENASGTNPGQMAPSESCDPSAPNGKLGAVTPELRELGMTARRIVFPSATVTLSGVVPSTVIPGAIVPNNTAPNNTAPNNTAPNNTSPYNTSPNHKVPTNVPRQGAPFTSSLGPALATPDAPAALPLRFLSEGNPPSLWVGAACTLFALAETLCELPESERLTVSISESEVNARGELILVHRATSSPEAAAYTEATVVEELVQRLLRATADDTSGATSEDQAATSALPDWLRQLHSGEHRPASIAEFAMWLGVQLNLPRSQQADEIRQWVRKRRRMAQTHEGMLMRQLGGALACLSTSPQVTKPTQRQNAWMWLSALVIVLGVGVAAHFLLR